MLAGLVLRGLGATDRPADSVNSELSLCVRSNLLSTFRVATHVRTKAVATVEYAAGLSQLPDSSML